MYKVKVKIGMELPSDLVAEKRLETGTNVSEDVIEMVDPADLSKEARVILLAAGRGQYPSIFYGHYSSKYEFQSTYGYGRVALIVNSEEPSVQEIDAAILTAAKHLDAEREAAAERMRVEEEKTRRLVEARELLASELNLMQQYEAERDTLAKFLAAVPQDALRGTLKAEAHGQSAIALLRKKVEDASPVVIFQDDDDED